MGRSGSTVLRQMMDKHPSIISPPETFFVLHLMDTYGNITNWTHDIKRRFIKDLYTDRPFRLIWNIPKKTVQEALDKASSKLSYVEVTNIVRHCFSEHKAKVNNVVYVDKNPIYSILFNKLISAHPSSKVIHLIRDPRGVINGQMHSFNRKDIFALGHLWNSRNIKIENICKKKNIDYHLVKFEDLVHKPDETIKEICKFLKIEYSELILKSTDGFNDFYSKQSEHYRNKHISTQKPLSIDIAEKWKKNLSKKQLDKIAFTTSELARKYGYDIPITPSKFAYSCLLMISKLKLGFMISLVKIYFNLPLFIRKGILYFRSMLYDHRYKA